VETWETKVLMGLRLRVEYGEIADDMANKSVGYSCFTDPRNSCFEQKDLLLSGILEDSKLRDWFLRVDANGEAVWNTSGKKAKCYASYKAIECYRCYVGMVEGGCLQHYRATACYRAL
jgi:hypothetical protein